MHGPVSSVLMKDDWRTGPQHIRTDAAGYSLLTEKLDSEQLCYLILSA